jgi:hypothetical protein
VLTARRELILEGVPSVFRHGHDEKVYWGAVGGGGTNTVMVGVGSKESERPSETRLIRQVQGHTLLNATY